MCDLGSVSETVISQMIQTKFQAFLKTQDTLRGVFRKMDRGKKFHRDISRFRFQN